MAACIGAAAVCAAPLGAQQATTGTITGRVVDSTSQQPLANVTVAVPGTQRGALTGADGRFTITAVPAGTQRVRAQRIGYGSRESQVTVTAGGSTTVTFSLAASASSLSEVVVVGYGTQRREAVTGAVSQVKADEANVGVITNANQLVNARVAGVNVVSNSGDPGGGVQIRVRGGTSLSASNDPLYVIDGVPLQQGEDVTPGGVTVGGGGAPLGRSPLNTINPNDIVNITVLKDASATAIYGSRGANGVILIETKRGAAGNSQVEYNGYLAANTPFRQLDVLDGNEYRQFVTSSQASFRAAAQARSADSVLFLNPANAPALGTANTNWFESVLRNSPTQNQDVAFSGGSNTTQYRASLNYFTQQGVLLANGLDRYQGRINAQNQSLGGKLRLQVNLTASRVNNRFAYVENTGGFEGGVLTNAAIFNPTLPVRNDNGSFFEIGPGPQGVRNPVALSNQLNDRSQDQRTLGNVQAQYSILPTLVATAQLGVDQTNSVRNFFVPSSSPLGANTNGVGRSEQRATNNVNYLNTLSFTPRLPGAQELEVLGGYEYTLFDNNGLASGLVRGFTSDATGFNNLGAGVQAQSDPAFTYRNDSRIVSFFSRVNYGFRNRYFIQGSLRRDGSTRLAPGNQWVVFPGVSASWKLAEESFLKGGLFSDLTLRAGYGLTGTQNIRPYATQILVRTDAGARYLFGNALTTGFVAATNENPNLKWETTREANIGLDFGLSQGRYNGSLNFYDRTTRDLLLDIPVPQPAFVPTRLENIGSLRNRGFEATINSDFISRPQTAFSSGLVLTVERNRVLDLGGRPFILSGNISGQGQSGQVSQRIVPGEPIGSFYGAEFVRIDRTPGSPTLGQQLFNDYDDQGRIVGTTTTPGGNDIRRIGDANPDFQLGLTSNFRYKRFDASWLWRADVGRDVFNNTGLVFSTKSTVLQGRNFLRSALDDGTRVDEPAKFSSRWIENGSFLRLQNIQIGYNFRLPGFAGRGAATRVFVSGDNLLLFTPYSGVDPEVFVAAGLASRGIDYLTYPRPRTFMGGARIQF